MGQISRDTEILDLSLAYGIRRKQEEPAKVHQKSRKNSGDRRVYAAETVNGRRIVGNAAETVNRRQIAGNAAAETVNRRQMAGNAAKTVNRRQIAGNAAETVNRRQMAGNAAAETVNRSQIVGNAAETVNRRQIAGNTAAETANRRGEGGNTARRHIMQERRRRELRRKVVLCTVEAVLLLIFAAVAVLLWQGDKPEEAEKSVEWQFPLLQNGSSEDMVQGISREAYEKHPEWTEDFLTPNEYSRPGDSLTRVESLFVHYTANPGTSAAQNRSYFENLKDTHERSASAHFIIGYNGEIIQCVPLDEIAYAVMTRNEDSVSIECCYKAENGQFTQETYDSLISLLAWLVETYDLDTEDILRHYDCGGKKCPLYYTEHEDAWRILKQDVEKALG